jgi:hypothetical protein
MNHIQIIFIFSTQFVIKIHSRDKLDGFILKHQ